MAGKGTYVAYTPLKQTELKVGEYFNSFVDDFIKRNDTLEAAKTKALADKKTTIGTKFDAFKFNPTSTVSQLSDVAQSFFLDTVKEVGNARLLALNDPDNAYMYMAKAEKIYNEYEAFRTAFSSESFLKAAKEKEEAIKGDEVFIHSDNNEQLKMLAYKIPNYYRKDDGSLVFMMPKNADSKLNDPMDEKSVGDMLSLYTKPDETNFLTSNKRNQNNGFLDKQVFTIAKEMQDEYKTNYDGNRENAKKWFKVERGFAWFDGRFGSEYNGMSIDPIVNQYSKTVLKKEIINNDDYQQVKKSIIDYIGSHVGDYTAVDTRKTAQELTNDELKGTLTRRQIKKPYASSSSSNEKAGAIVVGAIQKADGSNTVEVHNAVTFDLGNGKTIVGFKAKNSKPDPKTGKYNTHIEFSNVGRDKFDRQTYERIATTQDVISSIVGAGKNPLDFISVIEKQKEVEFKNRKTKQDVGVIKYKTAYKPYKENDGDDGDAEREQLLKSLINN